MQRIFSLEGNGTIGHYPGGYTDYLEIHQSEEKERQEFEKAEMKQNNKKASSALESQTEKQIENSKTSKLKFSYNEQREFATIDDDIAALEQQIANLDIELSKESSNFESLQLLLLQKQEIEAELSAKMDRWVYLNDLADKINSLS